MGGNASRSNLSTGGSHPQIALMEPEQLHLVLQQDARSSSRSSSIDSSPISECPSSAGGLVAAKGELIEIQLVPEVKIEKVERPVELQPVVVEENIVTPMIEETV